MQYVHLSDDELARQIINGGHLHALGELLDRYLLKIYNKCLLFAESSTEAEKLTHDIFLKAFKNLRGAEHIPNFRTWFYGIAYEVCHQHAQIEYQQNNSTYWEFDEIEQQRVKVFHCDAEEQLLSLDADNLKKVLTKLHPDDRLILLMNYQDSAAFSFIAKQLNIKGSDVQAYLSRALERAIAIYQKSINSYNTNEQIKTAKSL